MITQRYMYGWIEVIDGSLKTLLVYDNVHIDLSTYIVVYAVTLPVESQKTTHAYMCWLLQQ